MTAIIEGSLGSNNRQQQSQSSGNSSPRPQSVAAGSPRGFGSPVLLQSEPASPRPHSYFGSPKPSSLTGSPKPSSCVSSPRPQSCLSSPRLAACSSSSSPRARSFQHQAPQFDMFSGGQQVSSKPNRYIIHICSALYHSVYLNISCFVTTMKMLSVVPMWDGLQHSPAAAAGNST